MILSIFFSIFFQGHYYGPIGAFLFALFSVTKTFLLKGLPGNRRGDTKISPADDRQGRIDRTECSGPRTPFSPTTTPPPKRADSVRSEGASIGFIIRRVIHAGLSRVRFPRTVKRARRFGGAKTKSSPRPFRRDDVSTAVARVRVTYCPVSVFPVRNASDCRRRGIKQTPLAVGRG